MPFKIICKNCGKDVISKLRLTHPKVRKYCNLSCEMIYRNKLRLAGKAVNCPPPQNIKCDYCKKIFKKRHSEIKHSKHNFCSQKCHHKNNIGVPRTDEYKKKMSKTMKERSILFPKPHKKFKLTTLKCPTCKKNFSLKPYDLKTRLKETHSEKLFCSRQCVKNNIFKILNTKLEFQRLRLKGLMIKPTKPESILVNIITRNELPFKYVGDGEMILGGLNPDFISIEGEKIIIEVFGDYWHSPLFNINIRKDGIESYRKKIFRKYGYKLIIIWESELKHLNETQILKKIGYNNINKEITKNV